MSLRINLLLSVLFLSLTTLLSCKNNNMEDLQGAAGTNGFPVAVSKIMETRCNTSGCHNATSYQNAAGLLINSWDHLFDGGSNGAVVIPFSPQNSSLLYFINTHSDLGPVAQPTMPYNEAPLSLDEYMIIHNWIANGAPNISGNLPFASDPETRQKIYLTMQGCDLIAVIDAAKRVVMRYIPVGKSPAIESPHCVRVSNDGQYAYVSFLGGQYIQKIDTRSDTVVAEVNVGSGSWNIFQLSPDGKRMMLSDWQGNGKMLLINTETMQVEETLAGSGLFVFPHGIATNEAFTTFYVTAQYGNTIYKFTLDDYKMVSLDENPPATTQGLRDPHEIMMTPDHSKYFVTCEASNEVRVMDANADTLIKAIPVGIFPQEIALSRSKPYMFITCMEDASAQVGYKGSVYVINYNTYEVTRIDGPFYQPHGITVDDRNGIFYVASRNANPTGPAPHHSSSCEGRNGYYNVYDLNTLQRLPKRYEVSVEPYSADTRFK